MPKEFYSAGEAAKRSGSASTRCAAGTARAGSRRERDASNRRIVAGEEIERLRGDAAPARISARNRFSGIVTRRKIEGLMAQVELVVTEPAGPVAIVTRDAVEELGLKPGRPRRAIVKSTSVMVQH